MLLTVHDLYGLDCGLCLGDRYKHRERSSLSFCCSTVLSLMCSI